MNSRKGFLIWRYATFFLLISFVVTSSFLLFLNSMKIDYSVLAQNALFTFGNIFFLSFFCCLAEWIIRKITVDRPVKRIREATQRLTEGDLSARIDTSKFTVASEDFSRIAEDFNLMAEELSNTNTLRTDFVSNVSHELKTPLAVIRNYSKMLQSGGLTDAQRAEYAQGIDKATQRMTALITNILKMNKLENQQISPKVQEYDLTEQVAECLLAFDDALEEKQIDLQCDMDDRILVNADPELLTLVWNNLLSNAVKFTPEGGAIQVTVRPENEWAVVSVADTGCGMDKETGKRIFDKFYQGDTSHATEGNGLGLALVKRVVDLTEGQISVQSEIGKGSTFTVRIPRKSAH
ncbi:MAG: HAMP domain-containing histidine kinase [Clostridia bacterium]|nr:HAMP domain-containing histidine kinase [Clostridia bacterium]